jgi:2-polyprenyl-3-methyl-5-hydroxy-6-metoxy-1,4-benzoquinol methylase
MRVMQGEVMKESCLVCGANTWKKFSEIENGKFTICICEKCSFTQLYPIPTQEELDNFYSKLYRDAYSENSEVNADVLAYEQKRAYRVVKVIEPYFNKDIKYILDIGCSSGRLLKNIEKLSTRATLHGIEMNEKYKSYIVEKGIVDKDKVSSQNINTFYEEQEGKFDFISIVHVLEHLRSPKEALESIYKLLSADGLLYIEVPNLKTPYNDLKKEYFAIYHLYYFTEYTLGMLLRLIGFKILHEAQIAGTSVCFVCQKHDKYNAVTFEDNAMSIQYELLMGRLKKYEYRYPLKKHILKIKGNIVKVLEFFKIKNMIKKIVD